MAIGDKLPIVTIGEAQPDDSGPPHHHGSHRNLLDQVDLIPPTSAEVDAIVVPVDVDAIVVPTARNAARMDESIRLAAELDCQLVALCSKWSSADHVSWRAAKSGVNVIAVDIERFPTRLLPPLATSELLAGTVFERRTDTSKKRNLGLVLAHLAGWRRIVFLDDDITIPRPTDLLDAARLLDAYYGVGLAIGGFPDNSVVCHAYREVGGEQDTFIGGGALAVRTDIVDSFFPNIYNEDWFFLLDDAGLRPSAVTGQAIQLPYDPFKDDRRARSEELGDTLAEGIFALLDNDQKVQNADKIYWADFLEDRRKLIAKVIANVDAAERSPAEKDRMITALKAARGRSQLITPGICVDYLQALQEDRVRWRQHLRKVRPSHLAGVCRLPRRATPAA
jgi:hypothetical protein